MKISKILQRTKFSPIHLCQGDILRIEHYEPAVGIRGALSFGKRKILAETSIDADQSMSVDEAILFEGEFENRRALGGILLEKNK